MASEKKKVEYLVVDTTAFIQNASLQDIAEKVITCQDVVDEITNKRQLKRLVVLPYDLEIRNVFPENICIVTDFAKKTGDYPSLSATDIKVMALTYQLEKEKVGVEHLRTEPVMQQSVKIVTKTAAPDMNPDVSGFYMPGREAKKIESNGEEIEENINNEVLHDDLTEKFCTLACKDLEITEEDKSSQASDEDILVTVQNESDEDSLSGAASEDSDDDDGGWITPSNVKVAKKQVNSELMECKHVVVACMTTDFAMQNTLKQMNLNVSALDGRIIKQLRTFILRCYVCFKTTSIMTKTFCPKCGNKSLKKVAVSLGEDGKLQIHINARRPLTGRGKKFSLPKFKGGKHPNNPIIAPDQPMADNKPTRLARTKVNPLDDDYIAGFSPFAMRDVNSKSAQLGIRPGVEVKYWMTKNPNAARRRRK